jgi:hypothetical protein
MSTHSNIGIINQDNSVEMVYCHWNGYPSNNGILLLENYSSEAKVRQLLALGNLSSLGAELGMGHNFDNPPEGVCNFYGRDRHELDNVVSQKGLTVKGAIDRMEEYLYLWDVKTSTWFYSGYGSGLNELKKKDCKAKRD